MIYNYNVNTDILSKKVAIDRLEQEIHAASLGSSLSHINKNGSIIDVVFSSSISNDDKVTLDTIISTHSGKDLPTEENPQLEIDSEGRQIVRRATAKKGWHYSAVCAEIKTSTNTAYNKDYMGNDLNEVTVVMYDSQDQVTTDSSQCVKTVATIAPNYDFEIIEGDIYHYVRPSEDVRVWTLAGIPELGPAGVAVFVNGLNLRYMSPDDHIESDGRSSKYMAQTTNITVGVDPEGNPIQMPFQSNQFQFIFKHPAGYEHGIMVLLELYKQG